MLPRPRAPAPARNLEKTIILVRGKPNEGKTTLCQYLVNDRVGFLSFDSITDNLAWCSIKELHTFRETLDKPSHMIDKMNEYIDNFCPGRFVKKVFKEFIRTNDDTFLVIDGHFFTLPNNFREFEDRCRKYKYRLWVIDRHV